MEIRGTAPRAPHYAHVDYSFEEYMREIRATDMHVYRGEPRN